MAFSDTVKNRMSERNYDNRFPSIRAPIHRTLALIESAAAKRAEIDSHPEYNETGKIRRRRAEAEKLAPELGRARREIEAQRNALEKSKAAIEPRFPAVSEAMALALAARLATMSGAERAKALDGGDPRLLAAAFQMPEVLTGVDRGLLQGIRNKIVEATHGAELGEIADRADALDLADGTLRAAENALVGMSDLPANSPAAATWLDGLTQPSAAEREAARRDAALRATPAGAEMLNQMEKDTEAALKALAAL